MPDSQSSDLAAGIYERLLDAELRDALAGKPELKATLAKLDDEESPHVYGQFVAQLLAQSLRSMAAADRLQLVNRLIEVLAATDGHDYLARKRLLTDPEAMLLEIGTNIEGSVLSARPETPLATSSLLTGARFDPQLEHELRQEMVSADRVDILVSFIKWSGLRLLLPAFEALAARQVPVRIITTSYMGASDAAAINWLSSHPSFSVRVSYDTSRTRLHAKAYHFFRLSGYSTGYIGSANMSGAAMTSGLEWTVKVTAQDMPHILQRFSAEFETYWSSPEFEGYDSSQLKRLEEALEYAKAGPANAGLRFFAELRPYPFQERILESLLAARLAGKSRNLVVAATGTGKTVIAAFDYSHFAQGRSPRPKLLFVAHRKEILEQARDCFRTILRDQNFGELLVGGNRPTDWGYVFASVQSLNSTEILQKLGPDHFRYIALDEAHHVAASSYREIFELCAPEVLLGLTATPERMDGSSILPDFGGEFAAEIRLPEALEAKLLCPFHYFGITDPVSLADEHFWRNGQYDTAALTNAYTGDDLRAHQRLDVIFSSLARYQPDLSNVRAVGFCASVGHAEYMADAFRKQGHKAEVIVGETPSDLREVYVRDFRSGKIGFLFAVDVLSEGVDVPEINLVMFLRPTESLTVFLQQLGRGLRHHVGKESLTVLDLVGQSHRRYRIDKKFAALLTRRRNRIDHEVERDFPNLPPGCNIQLERVAREHILNNIRDSLRNFTTLVSESLQTFDQTYKVPATFANFIRATGLSPLELLRTKTWSEWKALAAHASPPTDGDLEACRQTMRRVVLRTDPHQLDQLTTLVEGVAEGPSAYNLSVTDATALHYLLWGKKAGYVGVDSFNESFKKWLSNHTAVNDLAEIVAWRRSQTEFPIQPISLPYQCSLQLHAAYGSAEIKAAFGLATLQASGPTGVGVWNAEEVKTYIHLVTFRKSEKDFSPTTQYRDYPISRSQLHWESQSGTSRTSVTGLNYLHFRERGYTILFFARLEKRIEGETSPFLFLGPAKSLVSAEGDRPIAIVWELEHPMPAALFEAARTT